MTKRSKYKFIYKISRSPALIPILYAIFGWAWILFSDNVVNFYFKENAAIIQTYKGWAYVIITALLLFILINLQNYYIFQKEREARIHEKRRKLAEERAKYSKYQRELLLNAIETSSLGAIILDKNRNTIYVNSTFRTLFQVDEIQNDFKLPQVIEKSLELFQNKNIISHETEVLKDGDSKINIQIITNQHENEKDFFLTCTILDISEQVKLKNKLKEKEEMMIFQSRHAAMGEMISMIAHQWRQPLSVISMEANNFLMDSTFQALTHEKVDTRVSHIQKQLNYLSDTIDDFRDFFRPDNKKNTMPVSSIVKNAFFIIKPSLNKNNISLDLQIEQDAQITTFARELAQVLINVLKNAGDAFEKDIHVADKNIVVTLKSDSNYVFILIQDNAGGIEEDALPSIFTPYFSTKSEENGTGLGLYIAKTIIENHILGTITASNQSGGALFTIKLPIDK